ncbi:MAG: pilus assembly protein TadG-related protein [Acidimicrobiales bacterium]
MTFLRRRSRPLAQWFADDEHDRGAVLIIISVSMVALLGMAALAVDLGNAWSGDRRLNTATDAAVLAGAVELLDGGSAAQAQAECQNYLIANYPEAVGTCVVDEDNFTVRIEATAPIEYAFAPVLGIDDGTVSSLSEATLQAGGAPAGVGSGMRPFGLCLTTLQNTGRFSSWNPRVGSIDIGIPMQPQSGGDNNCGPSAGNWGTFDFDGGSNSNSDVTNWIQNGYDGYVGVDLDGSGCNGQTVQENPASDGCYEGTTGFRMSSWRSEMDSLISSQEIFTLPIFDVNEGGNGANVIWHVVGIAQVRLSGYCNGWNKANMDSGFQDPNWDTCKKKVFDPDYFQLEFIGSTLADGVGVDPDPDVDTGAVVLGGIALTALG